MKIYKEKQYLVFDFEDGSTVKYDFATKQAIGKKGKVVTNLKSQLQGLTISELCDCCVDKQYGKFLKFIQKEHPYVITNIGTILEKVPEYSKYEQIFSAGFEDCVGKRFNYSMSEIPKGLIKIAKDHKIKLSNKLVKVYKENPNVFNMAYQLEYISLTDEDILNLLEHTTSVKNGLNSYGWTNWEDKSTLLLLVGEYGYNAKPLMTYIDHLKTFEAMDNMQTLIRELYDYVNMMSQLSPKFDKYPKHFLTTHQIASRNYRRLKAEFDEKLFKNRIDKSLERTIGDYRFIYPESTQAIKEEAAAQSNCVASYIQRVIDGQCHIMFLRYKDEPNESLVTLEIRGDKIVQAKRKYNYPCTAEQNKAIETWEKWKANKTKEQLKERELEVC